MQFERALRRLEVSQHLHALGGVGRLDAANDEQRPRELSCCVELLLLLQIAFDAMVEALLLKLQSFPTTRWLDS